MTEQRRILVVKLADIGDAVLALPAIQALRAGNPSGQLDVLTTNAGANVFERSPSVDEVITLDKQRFDHVKGLISPAGLLDLASLSARLRRKRYDMVFLLHHLTTNFGTRKFHALCRVTGAPVIAGLDNGRGTFLTHRATDFGFGARPEWQYGLDIVHASGIDAKATRPEITISDAGRTSAAQLLNRHAVGKRYAVIHTEVGEFSPARAWPIEYFAEVTRALIEDPEISVIIVGVLANRPELEPVRHMERVFDLSGQTSFDELCAVIEGAELVIGADSSVAHIAGAFDRPTIAIFGPSNIDAWKPFGATTLTTGGTPEIEIGNIVAIHTNLPCSPCLYTGFRLGRPQGCRSRICMTGLLPEQVTDVASLLISRERRSL
jgi:ADP-heptose:LPS heptosyltransferase